MMRHSALAFLAVACSIGLSRSPARAQAALADSTKRAATDTVPPGLRVYADSEVDSPVAMKPGVHAAPIYPEKLRRKGISGRVMVECVVNPNGKIDLSTVRIVSSTDSAFTQAVMDVLPKERYVPAELDNHKVRQRIQKRFTFDIPSAADLEMLQKARNGS